MMHIFMVSSLWVILILLVVVPAPSQANPIIQICHWECAPYNFRSDWFHPRKVKPCVCVTKESFVLAKRSGTEVRNALRPSSNGLTSPDEPTIAKAVGGPL